MPENVLVTGGAGYIGSHACKALKLAGFVPVTLDNLSTGWREAVRFGPFEFGNLSDGTALDEIFARHTPMAVMHFAASSDVGESARDPEKYWRNNVGGTLALLRAMDRVGCDQLVLSSTCAVYGDVDGPTIDEDTPANPINAYGASKRAVEDMVANFCAARGLRATVFRYFNVAGADPEAEIGEFHRPETHLVPLVLDALAGRRPALTIYGTDYPTRDGTCIRDYVHVTDLIEAHILGLTHLLNGGPSRLFNLGTGHGFSVREVLEAARRISNRPVPATEGPRRAGDAVRLVSDRQRAGTELGWQPSRSDMPTIIADAMRWHETPGYSE